MDLPQALIALLRRPSTSSPTANLPASGPTAMTTPARSLPWPDGKFVGNQLCMAPERILASPGLMPAARTATTTSPAAGSGIGVSVT